MVTATRRSVLRASATGGLAAGLGTGLGLGAPGVSAASAARVPLRRKRRRVVIIGSGFGGAISAHRLTQAGVPVTILEQGRRWPSGPDSDTFPTVSTLDERALFYDSVPKLFGLDLNPAPYVGLFKGFAGPMTVMTGCGWGGGSLTYQGMTLEPARHVFEEEFPAGIDYDEMHREHYRTVRRMLKLETAPEELIAHDNYKVVRIFKERAEAAGYDVDKIPMPIDWDFALRELAGEMEPAYTTGNGAIGVNNGGKHSLDNTYLRRAEATGLVEARLLHRVTGIRRTKKGEWEVAVDRTDERGRTRAQLLITTPTLIMGAGSVGTTKMLVRAGALGDIPDLPESLGTGWGTNADRIYLWTSLTEKFGPYQGGPVVYGSKEWDDPATANTIIQASIPPILLGGLQIDPNTTTLVGYGVSKERGSFAYNGLTDDVDLSWRREGDRVIQERISERVGAVAGLGSVLLDTNAVVPSIWHPMGGANAGQTCDLEGRVEGQRGLYVLDGALLPGSAAACNPSMSIAAMAEQAMKRIVRKDVGIRI